MIRRQAHHDEHNEVTQHIRPARRGSTRCALGKPPRVVRRARCGRLAMGAWFRAGKRSTEPISMPSSGKPWQRVLSVRLASIDLPHQAQLRGKTSVMRCHRVCAEEFTEMMRHAFAIRRVFTNTKVVRVPGSTPRGDDRFLPHFIRHNRLKRRLREFDRQIRGDDRYR